MRFARAFLFAKRSHGLDGYLAGLPLRIHRFPPIIFYGEGNLCRLRNFQYCKAALMPHAVRPTRSRGLPGCRIRAYAGGALLPGGPFCNLGLRAPKFHSAKRLFKGRRMFHGFLRYAHRNFKRVAFPRTHIPAHPLQNGRFFICAGGSQCIRIFTISRLPQDFWEGGLAVAPARFAVSGRKPRPYGRAALHT